MVGLAGVEPATNGLGNRCSIHLSYRPLGNSLFITAFWIGSYRSFVSSTRFLSTVLRIYYNGEQCPIPYRSNLFQLLESEFRKHVVFLALCKASYSSSPLLG